jgi:DNA-binding CsgD family transcriptional regulator
MQSAIDIIGLIYEAVEEPSRWQSVLDTFVAATQGIGGSLFVGDPKLDEYGFVCRHRMSKAEEALYSERYSATDGWAVRVAEFQEGFVGASHDIWPEEQMLESLAYQEFYGPRNWHYGMGGIFLRTPTGLSAITMIREKEKGPCGESELGLLRTLMPHLRRAALLYSELTSLSTQRAAFLGHLDRYPQAFLLVNSQRRVLVSNIPGRDIVALQDGLQVDAGELKTSFPEEDAQLRDAVREIASDGDPRVSRLSINRPSEGSPYRLLLVPVPRPGPAPFRIAQPAVAIVVVDASAAFCPEASALRELFSLTSAEITITSLLVQGRSTKEIAIDLGISFETVRSHVRRLFAKTATNRQGEFIALILRTIPFERV